jgi:hypothetical protein
MAIRAIDHISKTQEKIAMLRIAIFSWFLPDVNDHGYVVKL